LKLFETLCYNFYAKAVAMMKCMNTNNAVDYDNDDTDEVITFTQAIELNMPYSKIKSSAVVINEKTKNIQVKVYL
jgi:hypothetical protein